MFVGRNTELKSLVDELNSWEHKTAILVYGKRRVGKSTLISRASNSFDGIVINHICVNSSFEGNLELIYKSVSEAFGIPPIHFESIFGLMEYLGSTEKHILFIIDEYPYLKQSRKKNEVDSVFQRVIDRLAPNIKLILCGSYISVMKELLEEDNPLFGRFSLIQHIREFDYYDASLFFPEKTPYEKIASYAVFGGSPYVLEQLDNDATLRDNIKKLLMPETSILRSYIENVMLREIQKTFDSRILEVIGNGKKKYTEIRNLLSNPETGLLDKQLKILLEMETIQKTQPINRRNDKKKQFYEMTDNLMRFYFTYIFGKTGTINRIGEEQFLRNKVDDTIGQFISRRLEGVALQYFHRLSLNGNMPDIEDYGSYWYDDAAKKENGEFDVVISRTGEKYDFYECKYFNRPMSLEECRKEQEQLQNIRGISVSKIGFVCTGGFSFDDTGEYHLVSGMELFENMEM